MKKSPKRHGTAEEQIDEIRFELLLLGFASAKEIARLKGLQSGTMECPLCQQPLKFSTASSNNHFRAHCSTLKCISAME